MPDKNCLYKVGEIMKKVLLVLGLVFGLLCNVFANNDEFFGAAKSGDVGIVKEYIEWGINVNIKDEGVINGGRTALIHAVIGGHTDVVEALVDASADTSIMDNAGNTALIVAAEKGYSEIVGLLIKGKADVNQPVQRTVMLKKSIHTPLSKAFEKNHFEVLELLLAAGADINTRDEKDSTILMKASKSGDVEMVTFILKYNPNLTLKDSSGKTAEDVAKNIKILQLLKKASEA